MVIENTNIEATEGHQEQENEETTVETTGNAESNETSIEKDVLSPGDSKPQEEGASASKPTEEEILNWEKDKRFNKMWKNPNDLYKSYIEMEKWKASQHDPLKQQYDNLVKLFSDNDLDPRNLNDYINEYKKFKDPNNPLIARANYLSSWLENPLYKDKLVAIFEDLENQELQRKYPNMGAEERAKMIEMEGKLSEYDKKFQIAEREKLTNTYVTEITEGLEKCKQLAEKRGFGFPDNIQKALLAYCEQNEIPARYIYHAFLDKYGEQLDKSFAEKTEKGVLEKLNKNKSEGIVNAGSNKKTSPKGQSFRERLFNAL
jgi:hypothetical protein